MASVSKVAGRGVNSGPTADWANPGNIVSSNNVYASVSLTYGSVTTSVSDYIRADYFYFDIPAMATINGIVGTVERYASSASTIRDYAIQALKNGTAVATNKSVGTYWSTTEGSVSYGSPTDLWGTTWTPDDINNLTSGFAIRCEYTPGYGGASAYVDAMSMTVYYTDTDNLKYGTTSAIRVYYGTTEIKAVYYGTTQIA